MKVNFLAFILKYLKVFYYYFLFEMLLKIMIESNILCKSALIAVKVCKRE